MNTHTSIPVPQAAASGEQEGVAQQVLPDLEGNSSTTEVEKALQKMAIIDNKAFCKFFDIDSDTSKEWRKDGLFSYIRIKGKVYFRLSEIEAALVRFSYRNEKSLRRRG